MNSEALQLESTRRLGWSSSAGTDYFSCSVLPSHKSSKRRLGRIRFRKVNNADQDLNLCLSGYKPQIFPLKHNKLWKRQNRSLGHFHFRTTRDFHNSHLTNSVSSLILGFAMRVKDAKINEVVLQRRISKWHSGGKGEKPSGRLSQFSYSLVLRTFLSRLSQGETQKTGQASGLQQAGSAMALTTLTCLACVWNDPWYPHGQQVKSLPPSHISSTVIQLSLLAT